MFFLPIKKLHETKIQASLSSGPLQFHLFKHQPFQAFL